MFFDLRLCPASVAAARAFAPPAQSKTGFDLGFDAAEGVLD
jgi:hypothetical protein